MSGDRGRLLVVDDDPGLRELLVRYLGDNGYAVAGVADGEAMKQYLAAHPVDLLLLDVMLPGEDGLSLARTLTRSDGPAIIMLSARGEEVDRIVGLEVGADDYLPKPFSHRELLARVAAVLRRRQPPAEPGRIRRFGPFAVDLVAHRLTRDGERRFDDAYRRIYHRPPEEWHGLWELVAAAGVPATRRAMLRDELAWTGFGELASGVFVRPHEPARPLPAIVAAPGIAGRVVVAQAGDLPGQPPLAAAAGRAWDLTVLAAEYRQFLHRCGAVIERFRAGEAHDPEQCFVVRTLLVHAYRRVLLRDPLLPAALLPLDWPGAAAHTLCRDFYRLTHRLAETHLAATLAGDGESLPPANAEFRARFGGL